MKSIIVGITGASGSVYAQRLLARLDESPDVGRVDLVISQAGVRVVGEELGANVAGTEARVVRELIGADSAKTTVHPAGDIGATIASGSHLADAMIIVPCSMGTLAAIASGVMRIIPAMPSFYRGPRTIDDLVEHFTHRLLDHLGVAHEQRTRWEGSKKR
jgi:flavin prenyltransferase